MRVFYLHTISESLIIGELRLRSKHPRKRRERKQQNKRIYSPQPHAGLNQISALEAKPQNDQTPSADYCPPQAHLYPNEIVANTSKKIIRKKKDSRIPN
jgi:hypothetical protein